MSVKEFLIQAAHISLLILLVPVYLMIRLIGGGIKMLAPKEKKEDA